MWKTRLQGLEGKPKSVELKSVMTGEQLRCLYRKEYLDLEAPVFLMDYEISGNSSQTGLDLISELGIGSQSCLVTSHYQEPSVVESCKRLGVKLIPKSMSGFVPIQVH
jgi:hypothetical protein